MISISVKAPVKSFYMLKEPLEIGGCTVSNEKEQIMISTNAEAEDKATAREIALEKIGKAILSWSLSTNEFLDFNESNATIEVKKGGATKSVSFTVHVLRTQDQLKPETKEEMRNIVKLLKNADNYGIKCAEYYTRGIATKGWHSEAVLNFYKACELIYDKILAEASEEDVARRFNKQKEEVAMKEKMLLMCEKLGISGALKVKALSLPRIRSTKDVSHARLHETQPTKETLKDFMQVAKEVALKYLKSTANAD